MGPDVDARRRDTVICGPDVTRVGSDVIMQGTGVSPPSVLCLVVSHGDLDPVLRPEQLHAGMQEAGYEGR